MTSLPKLHTLIFLAASTITNVAMAQEPSLSWRCGGPFMLCKLHVTATDAVIPTPEIQIGRRFVEDLAAVRIDGRFGFVDTTGKVVVKPSFDAVSDFKHGRAEVSSNGKSGIIDKTGVMLLPISHVRARPLGPDMAVVTDDAKAPPLPKNPMHDHLASGISQTKERIVRISTGREYSEELTFRTLSPRSSLVWASRTKDLRGPFGLMDGAGNWVIEPDLDHVQGAPEDLAIACRVDKATKKRLCAGVALDGSIQVPFREWGLSYWSDGFAMANIPGQGKALIDTSGNMLTGRVYAEVGKGDRDMLHRVYHDGAWHALDEKGVFAEDPSGGAVSFKCRQTGLAVIVLNDRIYIRPADGSDLVGPIESIDRNRAWVSCNQPNSLKLDSKLAHIDRFGKVIPLPPGTEDSHPYHASQPLIRVKVNGTWGAIDTTGKVVIDPQFDTMGDFNGELFGMKGGVRTTFSKAGIQQMSAQVSDIPKPELKCSMSRIIHRKGWFGSDLFGIQADDGKILVEPVHEAITCFSEGVAYAPSSMRGAWCPIGPDGRDRDYPKCETEIYPYRISHSYPEKLSGDPFKNSVLWYAGYLKFASGLQDKSPKMMPDGRF